MAPLDWIVLAVLAGSLLLGAWRGLVYEVLSVLGWIAAFVAAQWFAVAVGEMLPLQGFGEAVRYACGFATVFIAALFACGLLAWLVKKAVEAIGLRPVDRTLGAAFGVVRGIVLVLALAVVVNLTPLKSAAWWNESKAAGVSTAALRGLRPVLPENFGQYLPG
jgi:membrane protein required for colicin V production